MSVRWVSSVLFRIQRPELHEAMKQDIENDRRLNVTLYRERDSYREQIKPISRFIRSLGTFVTVIFSIAAVIGCMITMYSAVPHKIRKIGILMTIGFQRLDILLSFLCESVLISLAGCVLGLLLSDFAACRSFSTTNFQTFADLSFRFQPSGWIIIKSLLFAVIMVFFGSVVPAWRASRSKVADAVWES